MKCKLFLSQYPSARPAVRETPAPNPPETALLLLLFLQWNRGHACVRWRALGGFEGAETKPWACCGKGPGNARPSRKNPARVVGRAGAFGFWLSARMGAGFAAAGWRRFSGKPLASSPCPIRNRPRRAPVTPPHPRPGNRLDFAPDSIAAKPLKPCDGGVFRGSFFAPVFAVEPRPCMRPLAGFERVAGTETKPWACCGKGPGNARPGSKSPAVRLSGPGLLAFGFWLWLLAFGFRLSAFGFRLSAFGADRFGLRRSRLAALFWQTACKQPVSRPQPSAPRPGYTAAPAPRKPP